MKLQISYRAQNWKEYNEALKSRGDLRVWISSDAFKAVKKEGMGRPKVHSNRFMELGLRLKNLFHLPYRWEPKDLWTGRYSIFLYS